jgi:hypothetical protein
MSSEYYEAAEGCFRLALELTENPELIQELRGLLDEIGHRSGEEQAVPGYDAHVSEQAGPERTELEATEDEYFAALCGHLPEPI